MSYFSYFFLLFPSAAGDGAAGLAAAAAAVAGFQTLSALTRSPLPSAGVGGFGYI